MEQVYKIIVTGPFDSGKSTFVSTASDIGVVQTERKITTEDRGIKAHTTVAMDYGRINMNGRTLHLTGTPGQERFVFMWEILAREMDGFVVMVDSTDPSSYPDALALAEVFWRIRAVPFLMAANKTDMLSESVIPEVRRRINPDYDITVMPCVAHDRTSVRQVLQQLVALIDIDRTT